VFVVFISKDKTANNASLPGSHSECEPPDPIPNSEVKPLSADGSAGLSLCESRTLPGFNIQTPDARHQGFFFSVAVKIDYGRTPLSRIHALCGIRPSLAKTARL
jgi:hypothetical protein